MFFFLSFLIIFNFSTAARVGVSYEEDGAVKYEEKLDVPPTVWAPEKHIQSYNDQERYEWYEAALKEKIDAACGEKLKDPEGVCNVLDVGTGTALFSIIAARVHPQVHVLGVEANKATFDLAVQTVKGNKLSKRITLALASTKELEEVRFPDNSTQADVLVTEGMGRALFDENVLNFLPDVRDRFLKNKEHIVPTFGCTYARLVDISDQPEFATLLNSTDVQSMQDYVVPVHRGHVYQAVSRSVSPSSFVPVAEDVCVQKVDFRTLSTEEAKKKFEGFRHFEFKVKDRNKKDVVANAVVEYWGVWNDDAKTRVWSTRPREQVIASEFLYGENPRGNTIPVRDLSWGYNLRVFPQPLNDLRDGDIVSYGHFATPGGMVVDATATKKASWYSSFGSESDSKKIETSLRKPDMRKANTTNGIVDAAFHIALGDEEVQKSYQAAVANVTQDVDTSVILDFASGKSKCGGLTSAKCFVVAGPHRGTRAFLEEVFLPSHSVILEAAFAAGLTNVTTADGTNATVQTLDLVPGLAEAVGAALGMKKNEEGRWVDAMIAEQAVVVENNTTTLPTAVDINIDKKLTLVFDIMGLTHGLTGPPMVITGFEVVAYFDRIFPQQWKNRVSIVPERVSLEVALMNSEALAIRYQLLDKEDTNKMYSEITLPMQQLRSAPTPNNLVLLHHFRAGAKKDYEYDILTEWLGIYLGNWFNHAKFEGNQIAIRAVKTGQVQLLAARWKMRMLPGEDDVINASDWVTNGIENSSESVTPSQSIRPSYWGTFVTPLVTQGPGIPVAKGEFPRITLGEKDTVVYYLNQCLPGSVTLNW